MAVTVTSAEADGARRDPTDCPHGTSRPSQRHWGFPGWQWSPFSDRGPTQRASGSCGTCLPLILWLKRALVPASPDERSPFRESKATKGPPVMALPRALLQALEQARGVRDEKQLANRAAHLSAKTPSRVKTTDGQMSRGMAFFQTSTHTTQQGRGRLTSHFQKQLYSLRKCFSHIYSHW